MTKKIQINLTVDQHAQLKSGAATAHQTLERYVVNRLFPVSQSVVQTLEIKPEMLPDSSKRVMEARKVVQEVVREEEVFEDGPEEIKPKYQRKSCVGLGSRGKVSDCLERVENGYKAWVCDPCWNKRSE